MGQADLPRAKIGCCWPLMVLLAIMLPILPARAQTTACPDALASQALDAADGLDSWKAVVEYRRKYHACDDGAIAEGISDSIVKLLSSHWQTLPELTRDAAGDRELLPFVIKHIDATVDDRDISAILLHARTSCPGGSAMVCRMLRDRAVLTLQEMKGPT